VPLAVMGDLSVERREADRRELSAVILRHAAKIKKPFRTDGMTEFLKWWSKQCDDIASLRSETSRLGLHAHLSSVTYGRMTREEFADQLQEKWKANQELLIKEKHRNLGITLAIMLSLLFGDNAIIWLTSFLTQSRVFPPSLPSLVLSPFAFLEELSYGLCTSLMGTLPERFIEGMPDRISYLGLFVFIILVGRFCQARHEWQAWKDTRKKLSWQLTEADKAVLKTAFEKFCGQVDPVTKNKFGDDPGTMEKFGDSEKRMRFLQTLKRYLKEDDPNNQWNLFQRALADSGIHITSQTSKELYRQVQDWMLAQSTQKIRNQHKQC